MHRDVAMPPLPQGTYTYEILTGNNPGGTGLFAVAAAPEPIPAPSPWMLGALSVVLMAAGWFWIGRR